MIPPITEEIWMVFLKSADGRIPCSSASELRVRLKEEVVIAKSQWLETQHGLLDQATGAFPAKETLREALTLLHPNSTVLF